MAEAFPAPTWENQLQSAYDLLKKDGIAEVKRHAQVSINNKHACKACFCCAANYVALAWERAIAYRDTIHGPADGWGAHVHKTLGRSDNIMLSIIHMVGHDIAMDMIERACKGDKV